MVTIVFSFSANIIIWKLCVCNTSKLCILTYPNFVTYSFHFWVGSTILHKFPFTIFRWFSSIVKSGNNQYCLNLANVFHRDWHNYYISKISLKNMVKSSFFTKFMLMFTNFWNYLLKVHVKLSLVLKYFGLRATQ